MIIETLQQKRQRAGQLGGLTTHLRHGSSHMAAVGSLGGRPRLKTLDELRQQSAAETKKIKGGNTQFNGTETNNLVALKRLFRERYGHLTAAVSCPQ